MWAPPHPRAPPAAEHRGGTNVLWYSAACPPPEKVAGSSGICKRPPCSCQTRAGGGGLAAAERHGSTPLPAPPPQFSGSAAGICATVALGCPPPSSERVQSSGRWAGSQALREWALQQSCCGHCHQAPLKFLHQGWQHPSHLPNYTPEP